MKKINKVILVLGFLLLSINAISQGPPPPPPPDPSGSGSNGPVGGNAPIGEGMGILLFLAAAYKGLKYSKLTKDSLTDSE
jgi:hypothetical protein